MAGESKDIELRIRARDYSQKTLDDLVKTLKELEQSQAGQIDAAKRGEVSARELEASYRKLENAAKALVSQHALTKQFETQSSALDDATSKVNAARKAQEDYAQSLQGVENVTRKQQTELRKLETAVTRAERAQLRASDRVAKTSERLREYGISTDNLAAAQQRIVSSTNSANAALERQDQALGRVGDDIRRARDAAQEKARVDQEMARAADAAAKQAEQQAAQQRRSAEEAEKQAKAQEAVRAALRRAADEAIAASKGYRTLATTIDRVQTQSLAKELRQIADPAGEAIKSLDGIDSAVGRLETKIQSIRGPIRDYRNTLAEVQAVQKSLSDIAGVIDSYKRQEQAVKRARDQFIAAEKAVRELTAQMRSGNAPATELNRKMREAQLVLRNAATEMRNKSQTLQSLKVQLRDAGVRTDELTAAERRLIDTSRRTRQSVLDLTAAYNKHGVEVDRVRRNTLSFWRNDGRTTLSWMQRLRGELLTLVAAYGGLYSAINLASGALEAHRTRQAAMSRLLVMFSGDQQAANAEWEYLGNLADRLKFNIASLSEDYTKFGVAAMQTGLSLQETRYIFERVAEASRAAYMTSDDFRGVMKALEQMISKGAIQMEELRQQLGDRLPGAFALAARGAGMLTEEFAKAVEQGEISSAYVINLARELGDSYAEGLEESLKSMQAAESALQTAIFHFQLALADSGFSDAYTQFIEDLTELLRSDEGAQLAQMLSDVFSTVADVLSWCARNVDILKAAFAGFIGLQVGKYIAGLGPIVAGLGVAVGGLFRSVGALTGAMRRVPSMFSSLGRGSAQAASSLGKAAGAMRLLGVGARAALRFVPGLGAALTAYEVYNFVSSRRSEAQAAGEELGEAIGEGIADGMERTMDPGSGGSDAMRVRRAIMRTLEKADEETARQDLKVRTKAARDELDERLAIAAEEFDMLEQQAREFITNAEDLAETLAAIEEAKNRRIEVERRRYLQEQGDDEETAARRRVRLAEEVARELERIEDDLQRRLVRQDPTASFEDRMRTRLAAVAHEYDKLLNKIRQLGEFDSGAAESARQQVEDYIAIRQEAERILVTQEESRRLEKEMGDLVSLRQSRLSLLQAQFNAGLVSLSDYQRGIIAVNDDMLGGIQDAADALEQFADTYRAILGEDVAAQLQVRAATVRASNNPQNTQTGAQLANAELQVNALLRERQRIVDDLHLKYQRGMITQTEMVEGVNEAHERLRGEIAESANETIRLAEAIRNPANAEAMDALILQMRELAYEAGQVKLEVTTAWSVGTQSFLEGSVDLIDQMSQSMAKVVLGQQNIRDMFTEMGYASAQFFAEMMRDIAKAIIRQQILNMLKNSGNPWVSAAASTIQAHGGALVGSGGGHTRRVDASWFAGAPKFHGGGLPGLQPSEVPAILEKGEEVLSRDDPRNILNGGGGANTTANRFVLVDDRSRVAEAMAGADGEKVTMVHLRKNIATVRQMLGGG